MKYWELKLEIGGRSSLQGYKNNVGENRRHYGCYLDIQAWAVVLLHWQRASPRKTRKSLISGQQMPPSFTLA